VLAGANCRRVVKFSSELAVIVLIHKVFQSDVDLEKNFFDNRVIFVWCCDMYRVVMSSWWIGTVEVMWRYAKIGGIVIQQFVKHDQSAVY